MRTKPPIAHPVEDEPAVDPSMRVLGVHPDPYEPIAERLRRTRQLLELHLDTRQPIVLASRSALIVRDLDLLRELARQDLVRIYMTMCTMNPEIAHMLEPWASSPLERLATIRRMAQDDLHAGVLFAPVVPGLTSTELETVLDIAADAGAAYADYRPITLGTQTRGPFLRWLRHCDPSRARMVLGILEALDAEDEAARHASPGPERERHGPGRALSEFLQGFEGRFQLACRRFAIEVVTAPPSCGEFVFPGQAGE